MPYGYIGHYLLQLVPETFLTILCGYAFTRKRLDKGYLISSFALSIISATLVFGFVANKITTQLIASLLMFISSALLLILYNKIDVLKATLSNILLLLFYIIVETVNFQLLLTVFDVGEQHLNEVMKTYTFQRWIYGLPNLLLKLIIIPLFYIIMIRTGKKKDASVK